MLECSKINVSMVNGEQGFTLKWSCSSMDPKSLVEVYGKMWPERPIYLMVKKHAKKNMVSQQIFPSTNPSMKRKRSRRRTPRVASSPWSCLIFSSELGVSWNGGTPNWRVYKGKSDWNGWWLGVPQWKPPICAELRDQSIGSPTAVLWALALVARTCLGSSIIGMRCFEFQAIGRYHRLRSRSRAVQAQDSPIWSIPASRIRKESPTYMGTFSMKARIKTLVGGFNPSEKYESQLGWLFPICRKLKNVPKHQPDKNSSWPKHGPSMAQATDDFGCEPRMGWWQVEQEQLLKLGTGGCGRTHGSWRKGDLNTLRKIKAP